MLSPGPQSTCFLNRLVFKITPSCFLSPLTYGRWCDWVPAGLEQLGVGEPGAPRVPVLTAGACPACLSPSRSSGATLGGLRGGGLRQAVQGAPSPNGQSQGLPSSQCQDRILVGLPLPTLLAFPSHCLCEGAGLSQWPELYLSWAWCSTQAIGVGQPACSLGGSAEYRSPCG